MAKEENTEETKEVVNTNPPGLPPSNKDRARAKAENSPEDEAEDEEVEVEVEEDDSSEDATEDNAEDDSEEEEDTTEAELDTSVWGSTGDETSDAALQVLQNSGVSPEEAKALLWDAVEAGDVTKVDVNALTEKVGKANATLIMAGMQHEISRRAEATEAAIATVTEAAGSRENWDTVAEWARSGGVDEGTLDEYRAMIDKGGRSAAFAASELVAAYNSDKNNTSLETTRKTGDGRKVTTVKALSKADYLSKVQALYDQGYRQDSPEVRALWARRKATIKAGK